MSLPWLPVKPMRGGVPLDALYRELEEDARWVCQAKLNGRRALWDGHALWSTEGNRIEGQATNALSACASGVPLDGEYVRGCYWAFDVPLYERQPLERRLRSLAALLGPWRGSGVLEMCPTGVTWADVHENGWEGVVFKRLDSHYKRGIAPNQTVPSWVKYRSVWGVQ